MVDFRLSLLLCALSAAVALPGEGETCFSVKGDKKIEEGTCRKFWDCTSGELGIGGMCSGAGVTCCVRNSPSYSGCENRGARGICMLPDRCASGNLLSTYCPGHLTRCCGNADDDTASDARKLPTLWGANSIPIARATTSLSVTSSHSALQKRMIDIHNEYAKLVNFGASQLGVSVGALAAVMRVEANGQGFSPNGRVIIRPELHQFYYHYTSAGKLAKRVAKYREHFRYNPSKTWTGHEYRLSASGEWTSAHQSQAGEWELLMFMATLDPDAAIRSTSFGAAQVMGFNYRLVGFDTPMRLYSAVSASMAAQFYAFFKFIENSPSCLSSLRGSPVDYVGFASCYNGASNSIAYGALIKEAHLAWNAAVEPSREKGSLTAEQVNSLLHSHLASADGGVLAAETETETAAPSQGGRGNDARGSGPTAPREADDEDAKRAVRGPNLAFFRDMLTLNTAGRGSACAGGVSAGKCMLPSECPSVLRVWGVCMPHALPCCLHERVSEAATCLGAGGVCAPAAGCPDSKRVRVAACPGGAGGGLVCCSYGAPAEGAGEEVVVSVQQTAVGSALQGSEFVFAVSGEEAAEQQLKVVPPNMVARAMGLFGYAKRGEEKVQIDRELLDSVAFSADVYDLNPQGSLSGSTPITMSQETGRCSSAVCVARWSLVTKNDDVSDDLILYDLIRRRTVGGAIASHDVVVQNKLNIPVAYMSLKPQHPASRGLLHGELRFHRSQLVSDAMLMTAMAVVVDPLSVEE
mmetsp:Transcript_29162/g.95144  ORF Transcript_29162/g.95144 Transcript_29162/m.95144 type:complete len:750 (-) Transcript_29162:594-2843(-)